MPQETEINEKNKFKANYSLKVAQVISYFLLTWGIISFSYFSYMKLDNPTPVIIFFTVLGIVVSIPFGISLGYSLRYYKNSFIKNDIESNKFEMSLKRKIVKKEIPEIKIKRDRIDWLTFLLLIISTTSVLFGITIQLPQIQQSITNLSKTYNVSVSDVLHIEDMVTACVTRVKTPYLTECSTCHEYLIKEINTTLQICDISVTNSITNTTNTNQTLKILK